MSAVLSPCGAYRYRLDRDLGCGLFDSGRRVVWVMLNPSTADATTDDPTMRRVIDFSRAVGATQVTVVNLFALRATDPSALTKHPDIRGPDADRHIREALAGADSVICGWGGSVPTAHRSRIHEVLAMVRDSGLTPMALGVTASGDPRHPLYLPKSATPRPWSPT